MNIIRLLMPPLVVQAMRRLEEVLLRGKGKSTGAISEIENAEWCQIKKGPLEGRWLFMNRHAKAYQESMLQGTFDQFLFDYIDRKDWSDKTIYDIGAHIGYHTLNFGHRVGPSGKVFAFEPHTKHVERIRVNLSRNADLAGRITLMPIAVTSRLGTVQLYCTDSLVGGFQQRKLHRRRFHTISTIKIRKFSSNRS